MRRRLRELAQPALLILLILGILSAQGSQGFPLGTLTSYERVVDRPGQYLEASAQFMEASQSGQGILSGRRKWRFGSAEEPLEASMLRLKGSGVAATFSDSGGSLQLCLLLVFCVAVLCCASMSISPWYKTDSYLPRKLVAALSAGLVYITDALKRKAAAHSESGLERLDGQQAGGASRHAQTIKSAKKAAKAKKRRGPQPHPTNPNPSLYRPIEKTMSTGSESSSGTVVDVEAAQPSGEAARPSGEAATEAAMPEPVLTPADVQIARIEAEAVRQTSQRLAKSKKLKSKQQQQAAALSSGKLQETASQSGESDKVSVESAAPLSSRSSRERPVTRIEVNAQGTEKPQPHRSGGRQAERSSALEYSKPSGYKRGAGRGSEGRGVDAEGRDRLGRRPTPSDRHSTGLTQVLLVPRRPANQGRPKAVVRTEEKGEVPQGPATPPRLASASPAALSSPLSTASPSRPYAQVARENLPQLVRDSSPVRIIPAPPPPPPRRPISALPKSAIFAPEFMPSTLGGPPPPPANPRDGDAGSGVLHIHPDMAQMSQPLHASSWAESYGFRAGLPEAPWESETGYAPGHGHVNVPPEHHVMEGSTSGKPSMSSPFPGMSLHRRTPQPAPPTPNLSASGTTTPDSSFVFKGLSFPGIFGDMWSTRSTNATPVNSTTAWHSSDLPQHLVSWDSGFGRVCSESDETQASQSHESF